MSTHTDRRVENMTLSSEPSPYISSFIQSPPHATAESASSSADHCLSFAQFYASRNVTNGSRLPASRPHPSTTAATTCSLSVYRAVTPLFAPISTRLSTSSLSTCFSSFIPANVNSNYFLYPNRHYALEVRLRPSLADAPPTHPAALIEGQVIGAPNTVRSLKDANSAPLSRLEITSSTEPAHSSHLSTTRSTTGVTSISHTSTDFDSVAATKGRFHSNKTDENQRGKVDSEQSSEKASRTRTRSSKKRPTARSPSGSHDNRRSANDEKKKSNRSQQTGAENGPKRVRSSPRREKNMNKSQPFSYPEDNTRLKRWRAKKENEPFFPLLDGPGDDRIAVIEAVRSGDLVISVQQFNDVINFLARQRKMREAVKVMELFQTKAVLDATIKAQSAKTFTIMIDVFGKSFQLSRAFALFYSMQRCGVAPNLVTFNAMIAACARNNEPDLAHEVFEEMEAAGLAADKFSFGALIDSYAKCGQVDRAFAVSQLMDLRGVEKDQTIYSALIDACGRTEQLERALGLYDEMKRNAVWPNMVTFSVLIDTCANAREPRRAFQLFSEVKHWGFTRPNVVVYTALIDACAKGGWPQQGEHVMASMLKNGVAPNEITFGALLEGWAREGSLERALDVLHRMTTEHGVKPNAVLIGGLVDLCRRKREFWPVQSIWDTVLRFNIRPARTYYPALIAMATSTGNLRLAAAIAMHAYARGLLKRISLDSEDRALHALACAVIYMRHEHFARVKNPVKIGYKSDSESNEEFKKEEEEKEKTVAVEEEGAVALEAEEEEDRQAMMKCIRTIIKSVMMKEEDMDAMKVEVAREFCLSWGDDVPRENMLTPRMRGGSRKDKRGVYRKDSAFSAAARRAKEVAASGYSKQRQ